MDIYFIRQSETRIDDDVNTNTLLATSNHDVSNHYRTPPPIFIPANGGTFQQRTTQQIDCRGCTLGTLLKNHLWWNGSDWLQQPESEWPLLDVVLTLEEVRGTDPERRTTVVLNTTMPAQGLQMVIDPTRYNRMEKLLRVTTCCLRWVDQLRKP
ncbi:hypothetical protein T06_9195 [Trichinella sp. T6]|nr:hypothetical protein T06_9195 [Trichinella sp. T6]